MSHERRSRELPLDAWGHVTGFTDYKTAENLSHTSREMRRLASPSRLAPQTIRITRDMIPYYRQHNLEESKQDIIIDIDTETAVAFDDLDTIVFLHETGVLDLDYTLEIAAGYGSLAIVQYLVEHDINNEANIDWALVEAAENGYLDVVQYLVEHGADIHADEDYALLQTARNGHFEIVRYLVEQGADVHAREDAASRVAAQNGHWHIVEYLESLN